MKSKQQANKLTGVSLLVSVVDGVKKSEWKGLLGESV